MKFEYLLFNFVVLAGPLAYSFEKNINFRQYWREAFGGIVGSLLVYVAWDSAVTNRHWYFNAPYMLDFRFFKLFTTRFKCLDKVFTLYQKFFNQSLVLFEV